MASSLDTALPPPAVLAQLDHSDHAGIVIGTAVLFMTLATIAVGLRLYTRQVLLSQVGVDDYLAALSLLGALVVGSLQLVHSQNGLGKHMYDLDGPAEITAFFRYFWIGIILYNATLLFIKLTLFFQYYRIVKQVSRWRHAYIVIMCLVVAWSITQIFLQAFQCTPVYGFWDLTVKSTCLPQVTLQIVNSAGNMATDIIVLLLPIPVVWGLNLKRAQKWALIGIFSLGFFTCIVSMLRLIFMLRISQDISFDSVAITSWSEAELTTGIICAALPTLRPLVGRMIPALGTRGQASHSYKMHSSGRTGTTSKNHEVELAGDKVASAELGFAQHSQVNLCEEPRVESALGMVRYPIVR